jgi:hypothetical protein
MPDTCSSGGFDWIEAWKSAMHENRENFWGMGCI